MQLKKYFSRSNILSFAMIGAAGIITWYGLSEPGAAGSGAPAPANATTEDAELPKAVARADSDGTLPAPVEEDSVNSGLPTRVVIPSSGVDAPVEGVGIETRDGRAQWETADNAVGHHVDSAMPGNPGNVVLTGHVSVADESAIPYFEPLLDVVVGDVVEVHSGHSVHRYQVEDIQQVSPETTGVLRSDHNSRVTLITCTPDLQDRIVVVGTLIV